jgi:hypothetical protein
MRAGICASLQECNHTYSSINNNNLSMKSHIKSFVITFVVAFAVVLVADIDVLTLDTIKDGTIFGVLFAGIRAGVKGVLELVIAKFS